MAEQVEGRLVGEVEVLHDQDREAPLFAAFTVLAEHRQQCGEAGVARDSVGAGDPDSSAPLVGDVLERSEGRGCEGAVAGAPGDPGLVQPVDEGLHQARLADAGFACDQHQPAVAFAGVCCVFVERPELQLPFEEWHG